MYEIEVCKVYLKCGLNIFKRYRLLLYASTNDYHIDYKMMQINKNIIEIAVIRFFVTDYVKYYLLTCSDGRHYDIRRLFHYNYQNFVSNHFYP